MASDDTQITKQQNQPPDLVTYYKESAHSAHELLERAVMDADDDYTTLSQNLKAVNQYIKARSSIAELIEKCVAVEDPSVSWDPFSSTSTLETKLEIVEAKAEFTAITSSESAAVALYQAGLTYSEISDNTGMSSKKLKSLVKKQGIQRTRKKSVVIAS
jgi:DNA-directed RNA polymerase specialized sigma24 family protein